MNIVTKHFESNDALALTTLILLLEREYDVVIPLVKTERIIMPEVCKYNGYGDVKRSDVFNEHMLDHKQSVIVACRICNGFMVDYVLNAINESKHDI
jgi:hypothetical protein